MQQLLRLKVTQT